MDRLKESPGLIVLGAAALATAGLLIYRGTKGGAEATDATIESHSEETEEILENSFFLNDQKSYQANDAAITKWMKEQCLAL